MIKLTIKRYLVRRRLAKAERALRALPATSLSMAHQKALLLTSLDNYRSAARVELGLLSKVRESNVVDFCQSGRTFDGKRNVT